MKPPRFMNLTPVAAVFDVELIHIAAWFHSAFCRRQAADTG